jgi:hypothetical protein
VHSFQTLLDDLRTICKNRVRLASTPRPEFYVLTQPTQQQQRAIAPQGTAPT